MRRRVWRNFDFLLLITTISIMAIGIALIYSATISTEAHDPLLERSFFRQILSASSGLLLLLIAAALNYQFLGSIHWLIYIVALGILGIVLMIGQVGFGAQSWLTWRRAVQPSELVKVLLIVFLAKYLAEYEERIQEPQWLLFSALLMLPPIFLIYRQPDLGTAIVLVAIWIGMVFTAGVRFLYLGLLGIGTAAIAPVIWFSLKDYMKQRILVFLNPASDVSGISYNAQQALISIGSGGWFGKGFLHGTQSQLYFLRVRHTDYVFSVLCEEFGFIGALTLLALLVILLWRILRAASMAQDAFGRLIACGVATMIFFQSFVNIAVNVGLLPVTGLTLPLVSYGGSSLWATLLGIGLVESVAMRHKKLEFGD
jgi:rod shape determining protein RodA